MGSILIRNIKKLVQTNRKGDGIVAGQALSEIPSIENAFLLIQDDKILSFGSMENAPSRADRVVDATGRMVFPSFCDSHTHLVFAASREGEFQDRIKGLTYEEIANRGGGIINSAMKLRQMSETELYEQSLERLKQVAAFGTGAIEIKSGYGLSVESELKMLRVIRKLKVNSDVSIKATFLGAHAIPPEYKGNRGAYVDQVVEVMLPLVSDEGLADYIDVFCEKVAFTVEETERIMEAGLKYGLPAKIHTNQFYSLGGIEAAVKYGARSVDHLEVLTDEEIEVLKQSETLPVLLPSAPFFLNQGHYQPARKIIDAGLPVVLASDYNPGTTPSGRMSFVVSLACIKMKMLPEEAINAATINGAIAMDVNDTLGSIDIGKTANIILTKKIPSVAFLPYNFGSDVIENVILKGNIL